MWSILFHSNMKFTSTKYDVFRWLFLLFSLTHKTFRQVHFAEGESIIYYLGTWQVTHKNQQIHFVSNAVAFKQISFLCEQHDERAHHEENSIGRPTKELYCWWFSIGTLWQVSVNKNPQSLWTEELLTCQHCHIESQPIIITDKTENVRLLKRCHFWNAK